MTSGRYIRPVILTFCAIIMTISGDYPPRDAYPEYHTPPNIYPREAAHSRFCRHRRNGNYQHRGLDLGDPRCTFIMCSNGRTIVNACPAGTRTDFFYLPHLYKKVLSLSKKIGSSHDLEDQLRQEYRNRKSEHGICDYFDYGGICGSEYPGLVTTVITKDKTYPAYHKKEAVYNKYRYKASDRRQSELDDGT